MYRLMILPIALLVFFGCVSVDMQNQAAVNQQRIMSLQLGMTKQQVMAVMGTETYNYPSGSPRQITNPHKIEVFRAGDHVFEVLFYYTRQLSQYKYVHEDELTPVVLKDGVVDGWGWMYWRQTAQQFEIRSGTIR